MWVKVRSLGSGSRQMDGYSDAGGLVDDTQADGVVVSDTAPNIACNRPPSAHKIGRFLKYSCAARLGGG